MQNFNDLAAAQRKSLYSKEYDRTSWFESFGSEGHFEFDIGEVALGLRQAISERMEKASGISIGDDLENAHHYLSEAQKSYRSQDKRNIATTFFFDMGPSFFEPYKALIKSHLPKEFREKPLYFQSAPNIRVQTPCPSFASEFPSFHTDLCLGHHTREMNIWVPVTKRATGHGFRLMPLEPSCKVLKAVDHDMDSLSDYLNESSHRTQKNFDESFEVTTEFGSALAFDGRCIHSTIPLEDHTRISIDIRLITIEEFDDLGIIFRGTGNKPMEFAPGGYYASESNQVLK